MNTKYDFGQDGEQRFVYVRPVKVADLPEELRKQAGDLTELYAVQNAEGERLALVNDRKLAFLLARQHDLAPVTVH